MGRSFHPRCQPQSCPEVLAGLGFGPWMFFQWRTPGWADALEAEPSQRGALQAAERELTLGCAAAGRQLPAPAARGGRPGGAAGPPPPPWPAASAPPSVSAQPALWLRFLRKGDKELVREQKVEEPRHPSQVWAAPSCPQQAPSFRLAGTSKLPWELGAIWLQAISPLIREVCS